MDSSKLDVEFHKEVYETLARHESCFHRVNATLQAVLSELQTMSISRNTKLWSFGNPTPSQGDIRSNVCNGQQVRASFHLSREEKEIPDPVYDEYPDEDEEVISQNIFSLPLFSPVSNSTDLDKAYWLLKPVTLASKKVAPEEKKIKDMSHERFTAVRARIPKRVLLVGPPETGKTLLTQAIVGEACSPLAGENGVPFFSASGSELDETIVGVGTLWAHDLFKKAKENVYCIVRTDEIDAVEQQRRTGIGDRAVEEVTLEAIIVCTHRIPGLRSKRVDLIKPRQSAFTKVAFKAVSEAVAAPAKFAQVSNVVITLSSSEGLSAESKLKTTFTKASKTVLRIYDDKRYKSESKKGVLRSVDICGLGAEPEIKKETHGLAVVNMDSWYVKVVDLYVLWSSIVPPNGQIKIVTVYSFEFGLQQMKEEEVHGFVGLFDDEAAKSDEDNNDNYIDKERLHTYEKSKMRYYYAVVGWDSSTTTDNIYKECDGLEFTQSSNALDLNEWFIHIKHLTRDVATEAPAKYECRDFYTRALQQGLNSNIYVGSSLVNMYGKYLLVDAAKKVIDGIDGKYIVIWNAMLGGYAKNEYVDEVMELFFSMTRCGIDPDEFTYTSILSSCTSLGYQEMGHQLYSITAKERFTSNFSCNAIIVEMQSHLSKFKVECRDAADLNGWGNVEQQPGGVVMLKVLDNLLPDLIYSENLVSSWKAVWVIEALKLKDAMVNSGIPMNIEIATSLMKGNSMLGDVTSALQGLNKVVEVGLTLNEVTFFVSIDLYSQTGNVEKAYEIFSQKKLLGILHTSFVVNHLLKGFLKRHLQKDACKLFDEPFEHGMANMVTYIVLLSGFCDEGKVNEICNLWDKMIGKRIVPSLVSYNNITTGPGYSTELMKIDMGGSAMNPGAAKALRQIKPLRVEVHYVVAAGCIAKQIHEWYTLEEFRGMPTISLGGVFFSMELPSYESSKSAPPEHMYLDSSLRTRILKRGRNDVFSLATCPCSSGATLARVFGWLSQIVVSNQ